MSSLFRRPHTTIQTKRQPKRQTSLVQTRTTSPTRPRLLAVITASSGASGADVSLGFHECQLAWPTPRDPDWQGSVRRRGLSIIPHRQRNRDDAPSVTAITRYAAKAPRQGAQISANLPLARYPEQRVRPPTGPCSVCHPAPRRRSALAKSFNGGFVVQGSGRIGNEPE